MGEVAAADPAAVAGAISYNRTEHGIPPTVSCRAVGATELSSGRSKLMSPCRLDSCSTTAFVAAVTADKLPDRPATIRDMVPAVLSVIQRGLSEAPLHWLVFEPVCFARVVDEAEDVARGVGEVVVGLPPPVVMEFKVPAGSRMDPVSTPFAVVEARPSAVWWHQVEPSFVRAELSVPAWTRP
ncbi:hypothetical protein ACH5AI_31010 [Streptomyces collinus]|uniref:hypothetical protein n=1 Tax=Streptomyces collinus TaxID=42684 RepID=UPI00379D9B87